MVPNAADAKEHAPTPTLGRAEGQLAAWAVLALIDLCYIVIAVPLPPSGTRLRALHHFYDAGQLLAVGLLAAAVTDLWQRLGPKRRAIAYLALSVTACGVAIRLLAPDLEGAAEKLAGERHSANPYLAAMVGVASVGIAGAAFAGRWLAARGWLASIGAIAGIAGGIVNTLILPADYLGVHLYLAWASAVLLGTSISEVPLPSIALRARRRAGTLARAALAVACAVAVVVPPSAAVSVQLFRVTGAVVAPVLVRIRSRDEAAAPLMAERGEWFRDRTRALPVPPSDPPLLPKNPIIVLAIVDALRAEVVNDPAHADTAPVLQSLRDDSVWFSVARSPASSTFTSVTGIFSSRYYSGQIWTQPPNEKRFYPHTDTATRFTEVLAAAGFDTAMFTGLAGITNARGPVRGFAEQPLMKKGRRSARARELVDAVIARVRRQGDAGLFVYTHLLEAHAPYDLAGREGTPYERYLREVSLADREFARLNEALADPRIAPRAVLFVTADHGEAFNEHGSTAHGAYLYEELVRVPLMIKAPGVAPRQVTRPVSLIDLAPTILDLAGLSTPGSFLGQSLVPFLRGADPVLTRPLALESQRLIRAMVFDDGMKLIRDQRRGTFELYDLVRDPGERENIYDLYGQDRLDVALAFFTAHLATKDYSPPYYP
jgi:hypothetical protein